MDEIISPIPMSKRINVILPETTIQTIDRMAKPGQRSRFINRAVEHFVQNRSAEALRGQLERAAIRDQDLDREVAADWFAVDRQTWQFDEPKQHKKPAARSGAKSTSRRSIQL